MSDELKDILNRVASGELSPEQAQEALRVHTPPTRPDQAPEHEADHDPAGATSGATQSPAAAPVQAPTEPVRRVSIRASAVRLVVLGDPSVDTAVADGPHRVARSGDTLTIHSDLSAGEYQAEPPRSAFASWLSTVNRAGSTLRVRVNPELPLEVLNVAGSLELSAVRAPVSVGVEAGSAKLHDGAGQLVLSVASGSADVEWQFVGESAVSTDLGSARVFVLPGSNVSITADATLGLSTIRLADGTSIKATQAGNPPVLVGPGEGRLAVTSRLGSLVVTVA